MYLLALLICVLQIAQAAPLLRTSPTSRTACSIDSSCSTENNISERDLATPVKQTPQSISPRFGRFIKSPWALAQKQTYKIQKGEAGKPTGVPTLLVGMEKASNGTVIAAAAESSESPSSPESPQPTQTLEARAVLPYVRIPWENSKTVINRRHVN
ncbi:hypothetical protein BT63DRAFT_460078 [Microthyrium microscopicum]|uniref:Uncharacterized protein n=1 Tax=Microthyrium microscopicum TaxID=703497 RepID=A0A6A6TX03_9PEZI|nr:hypothetical protein BT63DRAFT_460078 [Microthyrium microscopicum]